jgi:hypothetical protein
MVLGKAVEDVLGEVSRIVDLLLAHAVTSLKKHGREAPA